MQNSSNICDVTQSKYNFSLNPLISHWCFDTFLYRDVGNINESLNYNQTHLFHTMIYSTSTTVPPFPCITQSLSKLQECQCWKRNELLLPLPCLYGILRENSRGNRFHLKWFYEIFMSVFSVTVITLSDLIKHQCHFCPVIYLHRSTYSDTTLK